MSETGLNKGGATRYAEGMFENFDQLTTEHGMGEHVKTLRKYLLPCVGFQLKAGEGTGRSRMGGEAEVPDGFEWPVHGGRKLDFVLQIDLAELPASGVAGRLPRSGILSFFYDLEEQPWGFDPKDLSGHRVCYFPESVALRHRGDESPIPKAAMKFWSGWSLPARDSGTGELLFRELSEATDSDFISDQYHGLSEAVRAVGAPNPGGPSHRIGGHSDNVQGDMQLEAQLVTNGLYCGDSRGYQDPRAKELEKTCAEWQLLLQLDSDDDIGFMWGDCGMLYYWGREASLARGDFSRTWMGLQCC